MGRGLRGRKMHFFVKNTKQNRPRHISQFWGSGGLGLRLPSPRLGGGLCWPPQLCLGVLASFVIDWQEFPLLEAKGMEPKMLGTLHSGQALGRTPAKAGGGCKGEPCS